MPLQEVPLRRNKTSPRHRTSLRKRSLYLVTTHPSLPRPLDHRHPQIPRAHSVGRGLNLSPVKHLRNKHALRITPRLYSRNVMSSSASRKSPRCKTQPRFISKHFFSSYLYSPDVYVVSRSSNRLVVSRRILITGVLHTFFLWSVCRSLRGK